MSSSFDPISFLHATTMEVNERRPPLPTENPADPNGLYTAVIGEVTEASGTIGKGERTGQPWSSMVVPLKIDVPQQLREGLGLPPQITVTDRVFLDLTPDGRGIDNSKGKNRGQKAYRDATGTNVAGQPFAWDMLTGKAVKVKILHEMYEGVPQERVSEKGTHYIFPVSA